MPLDARDAPGHRTRAVVGIEVTMCQRPQVRSRWRAVEQFTPGNPRECTKAADTEANSDEAEVRAGLQMQRALPHADQMRCGEAFNAAGDRMEERLAIVEEQVCAGAGEQGRQHDVLVGFVFPAPVPVDEWS
jgi:hypothetical protein